MFCFCESSEKRLNSVRLKFADASISRLFEDRGRSAVSKALQRHLSIAFQNQDNIIGKIFSCSKRACFAFVNRMRNGRTAPARSLPTHRFPDGSKTEAASVRGTAASFVNRFSKPRYHWKDLFLLQTSMVCFCESNEKRLNSVRSKFADASISRLIEDRGRSEVQPSYRLSKVRETCAAFETLTWRKYETNCRSGNVFFFLFSTW